MGMNFSRLVIPPQYSNNLSVKQININTNFEIEIPGYNGYYYNFKENCVYSSKKGTKFYSKRNRMKIYSDKNGEKFVQLLRSTDNYRGKVYLSDIRDKIYKLIQNNNSVYNGLNPIILPGIIYDF